MLNESKLSDSNARALIARYAKSARRLAVDIRHERETRLLSIRQQLETELLEDDIDSSLTNQLIGRLVPQSTNPAGIVTPHLPNLTREQTVVINQQFIGTVQGAVIANLSGSVNLGPEPQQLLELINAFGGTQQAELESAVYELEDDDARPDDRMSARQRLQSFLLKLGGKVGDTAITVLQSYVESKLGL